MEYEVIGTPKWSMIDWVKTDEQGQEDAAGEWIEHREISFANPRPGGILRTQKCERCAEQSARVKLVRGSYFGLCCA